ncbi:hypothetical protein B0H13DRAFT_1885548 [Mycena leptocephala]|nr:hypothetical protein B0H13DRAFT_1885548 [Mycena leptocephala]
MTLLQRAASRPASMQFLAFEPMLDTGAEAPGRGMFSGSSFQMRCKGSHGTHGSNGITPSVEGELSLSTFLLRLPDDDRVRSGSPSHHGAVQRGYGAGIATTRAVHAISSGRGGRGGIGSKDWQWGIEAARSSHRTVSVFGMRRRLLSRGFGLIRPEGISEAGTSITQLKICDEELGSQHTWPATLGREDRMASLVRTKPPPPTTPMMRQSGGWSRGEEIYGVCGDDTGIGGKHVTSSGDEDCPHTSVEEGGEVGAGWEREMSARTGGDRKPGRRTEDVMSNVGLRKDGGERKQERRREKGGWGGA